VNGIPPPPRRTSLNLGGIAARFLVWIVIPFRFIWIMISKNQDVAEVALLLDHGRITQAPIVEMRIAGGKTTHYRIHYQTQGISRWADVSRHDYESYRVGQPVTVTYDPANLTVSRLGRITPERLADVKANRLFLDLFLGIIGLIPIVLMEAVIRSERRSATYGLALLAVITSVTKDRKGNRVYYTYERPDGTETRAVATYSSTKGLVPGAQTTVLYMPDNPKQTRLVNFLSMVKITGARSGR
jgi:hypothetical protein